MNGQDGERGQNGEPGAVGAAGPSGANGEDAIEMADVLASIASQAVVLVTCTDGTNEVSGSGTKTSANTVITAHHVVEETTSCSVLSGSPLQNLGAVTATLHDGVRDQVELTVDWTPVGLALPGLQPVLDAEPLLGDLMVIVGHPGIGQGLLLERQFTSGFVSSTSVDDTGAAFEAWQAFEDYWSGAWASDAVAWHGNSGGPVFNAEGQWVGLLVGGFNGGLDNLGPDLNVIIPVR